LCSVFFVFHRRLKRSTRMYGSYMSWSKLGVERTARWKLRLPKRNDTETRFGCVGGSRCECTMTMVSGRTSGSRARASFRPRRVWVHARSLTSMFLSRTNITVPQSLSPQVSPHAKGEALELEVGTGQCSGSLDLKRRGKSGARFEWRANASRGGRGWWRGYDERTGTRVTYDRCQKARPGI
jgi:hypothetical protein